MNRTDRLYALVEELRAVAPRPCSARWLAGRFEVSVRTVERDISALQQSGLPIWAGPGRTGRYCLDKVRTLPPVNLTPQEAVANHRVAVRQRHRLDRGAGRARSRRTSHDRRHDARLRRRPGQTRQHVIRACPARRDPHRV